MQAPTRPWVSDGFGEVEACFADLVGEGPGMAMAAISLLGLFATESALRSIDSVAKTAIGSPEGI